MALRLKEKELAAVGISVVTGCKPCTDYHVKAAREARASDEEIKQAVADALAVRRSATEIMEGYALAKLGAEAHGSDSGRAGETNRVKMNYTILRRLACVVQAAMFVLIAGVSLAGDLGRYKVVDGIGIYLGVMPTDLIADHPLEHTEGAMHGGVPLGEHHHHVMVALFEIKTGERITDAEVKANVREVGLAGQVKKLEPMAIAAALTYGNYFELRSRTRYLISVQVRRPESPRVIEARFEYYHH